MKPAILVLAGCLLGSGCKEEAQAPDPVRPVLTMTIVPETAEIFGPFAGTIEARYESQLGFQVAGRMVARDVYVGDVVKKGQRLAALDPTVIQFALTRAKADVADERAQLENASGVEDRQRTLAQGGNAPESALDNAVAAHDTAKAKLDQALAALRTAEDQVGYTELHASYDGVISAWTVEIGQIVSNGQAVVTEARPDMREAVIDIPDNLISEVKTGMRFDVLLQISPKIRAAGVVREIGPLADSATRSHRVRVSLLDPPEAFRLGTTVTLTIKKPVSPRILVPEQAILSVDGRDSVWIVAQDGLSVSRRAVSLATPVDGLVLVREGLAANDRIVTVGVHSLSDGQAVNGALSTPFDLAGAQASRP